MNKAGLQDKLHSLMGSDNKRYSRLDWTDLIVNAGYVDNYDAATMLFENFDGDKDGFITRKDIENYCTNRFLSVTPNDNVSDSNIEKNDRSIVRNDRENGSAHSASNYEVFSTDPLDSLSQAHLKNEERILSFFKTIESQYPSLQKYFEDLLVDIISEIGELKTEKEKLESHYKREKTASNQKVKLMEEEIETWMSNYECEMKQKLKEYQIKESRINEEKKYLQEEIEYFRNQTKIEKKKYVEDSSTETMNMDFEWNNLHRQFTIAQSSNMSNEARLKMLENHSLEKDKELERAKEDFKQACSNIQALEASLESLISVNRKLNDDNDNLRSTLISISNTNSIKSLATPLTDVTEFVEHDSGLSTQMEIGESENENISHNKINRIYNYIDSQFRCNNSFDESSNCDSDNIESPVLTNRFPSNHHRRPVANNKSSNKSLRLSSSSRPISVSSTNRVLNNNIDEKLSENASLSCSDTIKLEPERMFKLILAGDASVGKTSFMIQFCKNSFDPNLQSTVGIDYSTKTLFIDGRLIALQLWDTAGQERFRSIVHSYFRRSDGILLIYDVTNPSSFINIRSWIERIRRSEDCTSIPIMLLANKTDVRDCDFNKFNSYVQQKEGLLLANNYKLLFKEISVKNNINIDSSIIELARNLKAKEDIELSRIYLNEIETKRKCC